MIKKKIRIITFVLFASLAPLTLHAGVIYSNNFEKEDVSCWNNISDTWRNVCGDFHEIGQGAKMQLSTLHAHSGSYSAVWRAKGNEDRGQAYVDLVDNLGWENGYDEIYVQIWNYFTGDDGTYDHGQQPKLMRFISINPARNKGLEVVFHLMDDDYPNDNHDSESMKVAYNGPPDMPDWGASYAGYVTPNNKWICFEMHVKLNTPGKSDGLVEFYIDGVRKIRKTGINIRGNTTRKFNSVLVGGWYSNAGRSSDQYNYRYMDDLIISTEYIGTSSSISTISNTNNTTIQYKNMEIPPAPTKIRVEVSTP